MARCGHVTSLGGTMCLEVASEASWLAVYKEGAALPLPLSLLSGLYLHKKDTNFYFVQATLFWVFAEGAAA